MVKQGVFIPIPAAAVLLIWVAASGFLLLDGHYQLFLSPRFGILIWISLAILCLYTTSLFFYQPIQPVKDALIKGAVLLMPILFIFSTGDRTLGGYALSKRPLTSPNPLQTPQIKESPATPAMPGTVNPSAEEPTGDTGLSILKLILEWNTRRGSRVTLEGVYFEPEGKDGNSAVVFRYLVSCCAADAQPLGVVIPRDTTGQITDHDWVRITGVVEESMLRGNQVIFMTPEHIEKKEMPSKSAVYIYQ